MEASTRDNYNSKRRERLHNAVTCRGVKKKWRKCGRLQTNTTTNPAHKETLELQTSDKAQILAQPISRKSKWATVIWYRGGRKYRRQNDNVRSSTIRHNKHDRLGDKWTSYYGWIHKYALVTKLSARRLVSNNIQKNSKRMEYYMMLFTRCITTCIQKGEGGGYDINIRKQLLRWKYMSQVAPHPPSKNQLNKSLW